MVSWVIDDVRLDDDEEAPFTEGESAIGSGITSRSYEVESWLYTKHKDYHLHFVRKKEITSNRQMIPASFWERLAYFRCFVSSIGKTHIFCMQQINVNRFIWTYMVTLFFKSLPTAYRTIFLAAYSPDTHLYVSKMVPIFIGCNIQVVIGGLVDLVMSCEALILAIEYLIDGISNDYPWNKCGGMDYVYYKSIRIKCYGFKEAVEMCKNESVTFKKYVYCIEFENGTLHYFQMAPIMYFTSRVDLFFAPIINNRYGLYCIAIWVFAAINCSQLFKKYIWKVLHYSHIALIGIYLTSCLHITWLYIGSTTLKFTTRKKIKEASRVISEVDLNFLCSSYLAPPIVHILTSRSSKEVNVGRDSIIMVASNTIFFLCREIFGYKMRTYCEMVAKFTILSGRLNRYPWFVFWPIFLSFFYFGNFMTIVFLSLLLTENLVTFTITYQCLIEAVVCEWRKVNRSIASIIVTVLGILIVVFTDSMQKILIYICVKGIVALTETFVINLLYPLERLMDDVAFHYGSPPTPVIRLLLRLIPFVYSFKLYQMLLAFDKLLEILNIRMFYTRFLALAFPIIPVVCGILFVVCKCVFVKKEEWKLLFRPQPQWGSRDHITRQLRKQYDSREYVNSQGSRYLSRHMSAKRAAQVYKLDIRYSDTEQRSITVPGTLIRVESDKKER